ncbi:MAG: DUF5103 domain-containing protein [Pseudoflavonifractor sp.]|nr:DUF5103 domain-containing protein [Pseudoflavonifractor sp.]
MRKQIIHLILLILAAATAMGQKLEVGSLTAHPEGQPYLPPLITRGGEIPIVVSFDLLEPERRFLRYSITHCDATWTPSQLQPMEYATGFNEARIDDYGYSQGTLIPYVNYRFTFPNEELKPIVSGNYLINIYDEDTPSEPLAQVAVMVSEQAVGILPTVTSRTDFDYNGGHQQLEIAVNAEGLDIRDSWNDLLITITPNGRADAATRLTRPMRVNGTVATFAHDPALTFTAGKEYRRFETVTTTRYLPMGVELVAFDEPWYHFKLYDSLPRAGQGYVYDQTQHGHFTIGADNIDDPDTQAEYVKVHFTLDFPEQPGADVVIEGALTGHDLSPSSPGLMTFNRLTNRYEAVLTLKQGSYNYQYLLLPHGASTGLTGPIEGDDYQTSNEYAVAVYYRPPGGRYDRLIGFTTIYSHQ